MIEEIKIKTTAVQLEALGLALSFERLLDVPSEKQKRLKNFYSVIDHVQDKILRKYIAKKNTNKPFNFTLKYFEAYALEKALIALPYPKEAQPFFDVLNQQLA